MAYFSSLPSNTIGPMPTFCCTSDPLNLAGGTPGVSTGTMCLRHPGLGLGP